MSSPATTTVGTPATGHRVGFTHSLRAEWIKLRSLRSTWYTLAFLFLVGPGITFLAMSSAGEGYSALTAEEKRSWDPVGLSLRSFIVAQLIVSVLGILVVTSEFATGLMQTSLAATPRRHRLLAAKTVVAAALAWAAGQLLMLASLLLGQSLLAAQDVPYAKLGDPGVLSAVAGGGLYLAAIALLAVGLGTIMRATAGALASLVGVVLLVPALAEMFPSWLQGLFDFWPTLGGAAVLAGVPDPEYPHPWLNLFGMFLGAAAVLAVAFAVFRRRDV
ncbi:ABC transporter permease [Actinomadura rifamycini]|uniref:ABC transporter permease n=1 Tax=Actinomadura rifamycini TaxID=31962 RepID=UPI00041BB3A5|nr:ABC transporter permease [Actinomadura rifamycini]